MVKTALLHSGFVVAFALLGAACTDPLSLENRSCPCDNGYVCCKLTNQCLEPVQTCAEFAVTVSQSVVRQGDEVKLTITGPELTEINSIDLGDLGLAGAVPAINGAIHVAIQVPHGTKLGPRALRFSGRRAGRSYQSPPTAAVITVSPIVIADLGDDAGPGTTVNPFRTLEKALAVVGEGDTLQVAAGVRSLSLKDGGPIALPNGVTLRGETTGDRFRVSVPLTVVSGQIWPKKDLTIGTLKLDARVVVSGPKAAVTLENVQAEGTDVGVRVDPEAVGASVMITGELTRIASRFQIPVKIQASNVTLKLIGVEISNLDTFAAVALDGNDVEVMIGSSRINSAGGNAIQGYMRAKLWISGSWFRGILNLEGPGTVAEIYGTTFKIASDTRADGGLRFRGDLLSLTGCTFNLVGLLQANSESRVVVRETTFDGYLEPAISLEGGDLDLGSNIEQGNNQFTTPASSAGRNPVAVNVRAKTGTASVSLSTTRINGRQPPAGMVMGPATDAPYYQIENMVPIQMF